MIRVTTQRYSRTVASPLDQKLSALLGGRTAAAFQKAFGQVTVGDLLAHYPRRYARRGELTALTELPLDEAVTIVAEVLEVRERPMKARKGSILEVRITDGRGIITLTFFNQAWRKNDLRPGARGIFAGKVGDYRGSLQLAHPDYELFEAADAEQADTLAQTLADPARAKAWAEVPIPIYPATSTVASWQLQKAIAVVLDTLSAIDDPVPDAIAGGRGLLPFARALEFVHRPPTDADAAAARASLRFQEAFVLQAALVQQRQRLRAAATKPRVAGALLDGFDARLPFTLTGDQRAVGEEIARDLADSSPMNRLVQGEVGSGKTLVAVRAMLAVAQSGGQTALLAPTEVLAHQHLRSIVRTLAPDLAARLRPTILTGQLPTAERKKALLAAASGSSLMVIGTHALLAESVGFADLALVVVDEQHRFGVEQRETLRLKGAEAPHVLVLTATPIPRTVAMTVFGDLDISSIAELPSGRLPIESFVVPLADKPGWMPRVWQRLAEELAKGRQAFVVCSAIDATHSDEEPRPEGAGAPPAAAAADARASGPATGPVTAIATVLATLEHLRALPHLSTARIEALHGRMSSDEKDRVMQEFANGAINVLVATTVIEVGVDVPNASMMVILDADRFGLSQLHQLRGRVGRGEMPGLCLFVTGVHGETLARERVEAVASTLDGFELAQRDLELRQEGDVLGRVQSGGRSSLRLLRVVKDAQLISEARELAAEILERDPSLESQPALREALERRLDATAETFLAKN
ncbi:MAG: ATP-dependent DNA helicase RecG [Salinibacterium sp.]|nr:ATP-dependent DNA helicase RecG [Salinibacterium sp.]